MIHLLPIHFSSERLTKLNELHLISVVIHSLTGRQQHGDSSYSAKAKSSLCSLQSAALQQTLFCGNKISVSLKVVRLLNKSQSFPSLESMRRFRLSRSSDLLTEECFSQIFISKMLFLTLQVSSGVFDFFSLVFLLRARWE